MATVLQVNNDIITAKEVIPLLTRYQMLPRLLVEIIIDQAIASITCTTEEIDNNYHKFCEKNQLCSETQRKVWLERYRMTPEQLKDLATRGLKIEKFKQETWGYKLQSYFFSCKSQLDKVNYSVIWTRDIRLAQELYFRLEAGEQPFAELAREYSQGSEAQSGGFIGPIELSNVQPDLAKILSISQVGQLWSPIRFGEWVVIVQLEKLIPAQLDEPMRQRLLNELFADWLQEQLNQLRVVL
jgi:parvulin-like peptidyl-prolyl isomerase